MADPAIGAAASLAKGPVTDLYVGSKKWFASLDPTGKKLANYREGIREALSQIQIMGMASPRELKSVYIALRALPTQKKYLSDSTALQKVDAMHTESVVRRIQAARHQSEIDNLIKDLGYADILRDANMDQVVGDKRSRKRPTDELSTELNEAPNLETLHGLSAIKLVQKHKKLMILGHPGSGKTTFLKYLALAYTGFVPVPETVNPLLPVFIPLREVRRIENPKPTAAWLRDLALSCASDFTERQFSKEWLEAHLEQGQCAVLLDGIDEIPPDLASVVVQSIGAFASKYRRNIIVTTCRVGSFERAIPGFKVCEADDFNDDDVAAFVSHWCGDQAAVAATLLKHIAESRLARDLCRTPLLLTLLCILYDYGKTIPRNRAELYETCIDALMFRWDTSRSLERPSLTNGLSPIRKKMMLSRIAKTTFDKAAIFMRKNDVLNLIDAELKFVGVQGINSDAVLKELESHNGLLVERAVGVYGFSHLTFHEFLTMLAYHEDSAEDELYHKAMEDPRYREVFLMLLERLYAPDQLVLAVARHIKSRYLNLGKSNAYMTGLLSDMVRADISVHPKVRAVLKEIELESLAVG